MYYQCNWIWNCTIISCDLVQKRSFRGSWFVRSCRNPIEGIVPSFLLHPTNTGDFNSFAPEKFEWNFRHVIFKHILVIDGWGISCEIVLKLMSLDFTDDQSTLVQVMAWCRQATSHYLSQCWPRSMLQMASLGLNELTYWGWDKMVIILQTTISNAFF